MKKSIDEHLFIGSLLMFLGGKYPRCGNTELKISGFGVPWWLSRLRILSCHCYGLGHYYGVDSIPGMGIFSCCDAVGVAKKRSDPKFKYVTENQTKKVTHLPKTSYSETRFFNLGTTDTCWG